MLLLGIALLVLFAAVIALGVAAMMYGPPSAFAGGQGDFYLANSAARTASGVSDSATEAGAQEMRGAAAFLVEVNVSAASGTTPTLDLYIQSSFDKTNWDDCIHFTQITAAARRYARYVAVIAPATAEQVQQDAALAAGTVRQGPVAPFVRAKWVITGTTPSFTFTVKAFAYPTSTAAV